jgi:hypothetical protein
MSRLLSRFQGLAGGFLSAALAIFTRSLPFRSPKSPPRSTRMLAALRNEFGGHAVKATSLGEKKGRRDG